MGPGIGGGRRCRLVEAGTTLVPHRPIVPWSRSSLWVAFVSRYGPATSSSVSFFSFCSPFPSLPLPFPSLPFLAFVSSSVFIFRPRCSSLPPSLRPSIITDQTIRGGSVAKVCFAHTTSFVFLFDFFFFDRGNVGRLTGDCPLIAFFELAGKNYANAYAYTRSSLGSKKIKSFERLHGT